MEENDEYEFSKDNFPWMEDPDGIVHSCDPCDCYDKSYICECPYANLLELCAQEICILFSLCCFPFCRADISSIMNHPDIPIKLLYCCLLPCALIGDLFTIVVWVFNFLITTFIGLFACGICFWSPTPCFLYNWIAYVNGFFYGCFVSWWCCGMNLDFMPCRGDAYGYGRGPWLMKTRVFPCLTARNSFKASYCHWFTYLIVITLILFILSCIALILGIIVLFVFVIILVILCCVLCVLVVISGGDLDFLACDMNCADSLECLECGCECIEDGYCCFSPVCCLFATFHWDGSEHNLCYMASPKHEIAMKATYEYNKLV